MVNRNPKPDLDYKRCEGCGGILSMRRCPVFLTLPSGRIVGPYHAGCAERIVLANKGKAPSPYLPTEQTYGRIPPGREETLPW